MKTEVTIIHPKYRDTIHYSYLVELLVLSLVEIDNYRFRYQTGKEKYLKQMESSILKKLIIALW